MTGADKCDGSRLCEELSGRPDTTIYHQLYGDRLGSRVIYESEHFALLPDISPLLPGHLLLVPRSHYISFGHVDANGLGQRLDEFVGRVLPTYQRVFGRRFTIVEHGSSSTMSPSACVTHAHWYLFPIVDGFDEIFRKDRLRGVPIPNWHSLAEIALNDRPYIYHHSEGRTFVFDTQLSKRHQYLRTVVAEIVGIPEPEWDWSLTIREDVFTETLARAREARW